MMMDRIYRMLKQRNDELFEENRHLQQEQHRQQQNLAWRSTLQQAFGNEPPPPPQASSSLSSATVQHQQQSSHHDNLLSSALPLKTSTIDPRRERSKSQSLHFDSLDLSPMLLF